MADPIWMVNLNEATTRMLATSSSNILNKPALMDPVSKLRVCQPQALIDTDFEYGLQGGKWETLELVNNIPSTFYRDGDDIAVTNVTATIGTSAVKVQTQSSHHLLTGTPFSIFGTESKTADGNYTVYHVSASNEFIYMAREIQQIANLYDATNTTLLPGRMFQGAHFHHEHVSSITTDEQSPLSTLTVTTTIPHGMLPNTNVTLSGTSSKKVIAFQGNHVQHAESNTVTSAITNTADKLNGSIGHVWADYPIVPFNWLPQYFATFISNNVDTVNNTITAFSHGFTNADTVMYIPACSPNSPVGGLTPYTLYQVNVVDPNTLQLKQYTTPTPSNGLALYRHDGAYFNDSMTFFRTRTTWTREGIISSVHKYDGMPAEYTTETLGYFKPSSSGIWTFSLLTNNAGYLWLGDHALTPSTTNALINNGGVHNDATVTATSTLLANTYYPIRIVHGCNGASVGVISLSFSGPGVSSQTDGTGYFFHHDTLTWSDIHVQGEVTDLTTHGTSDGAIHMLAKAYPIHSVNASYDTFTIDLRHDNNKGMEFGQPVYMFSGDAYHGRGLGLYEYTLASSAYANTGAVPYYISKPISIGETSSTVSLNTVANGAAFNIVRNTIAGLTWIVPTTPFSSPNSFFWENHGLDTNQTVTFTNISGTSPSYLASNIPIELTHGATYYVNKIDNHHISLKHTPNGSTLDLVSIGNGEIQFSATYENPLRNHILRPDHGLLEGQQVVYDNQGNMNIPGLSHNATYYVQNVTQHAFRLCSNSNLTNHVDLTGVAGGIHHLQLNTINVDGAYTVTDVVDDSTFRMQAPFCIPAKTMVFHPRKSILLSEGVFYIPDHVLPSWARVTYDANGNTPVTGLTSGASYYVRRLDKNRFILCSQPTVADSITSFADAGSGDDHILYVHDVRAVQLLSSTAHVANQSTSLSCPDVDFMTTYKPHDNIHIEVPNLQETIVSIASVDTDTNTLSLSADIGLIDGMLVQYTSNEDTSMPCMDGLVLESFYYISIPSIGKVQLHTTYEHAMNHAQAQTFTSEDVHGYLTWAEKADVVHVDDNNHVITLTPITHKWSHGDTIIYHAMGATPIGGLTDQYLYVLGRIGLSHNDIALYITLEDANDDTNRVQFSNTTATGRFERIRSHDVYTPCIHEVHSPTSITVTTPFTTTTQHAEVFRTVSLIPQMDGCTTHRPHDGGIEMVPSSNPGAQIIRQTRRYFRYQSGKGLQLSTAINFNPPVDIQSLTRTGSIATIIVSGAHRLTPGVPLQLIDASTWNGTYIVKDIVDKQTFTVSLNNPMPIGTIAEGYPKYHILQWTGSSLRTGMFDDQNGLFFEYDGSILYAVCRNSTKQLPGTVLVTFQSTTIQGTNTRFTTQLVLGDHIVIKGMTYKVTAVTSDTSVSIQPAYRGASTSFVTVTKTQEWRTPQHQWSLDPCDGTGPSGYTLNIHHIQMAYIDYSWYGAGKARFGFKHSNGEVFYCHEVVPNIMAEPYLRSGNLPVRYEVDNTGIPTVVPTLTHWGTSVIMDGGFDDDRTYFYTASGKQLSFAGGDKASLAGGTFTNYGQDGSVPYRVYDVTTGTVVDAYRIIFTTFETVRNLLPGTVITHIYENNTILPIDTRIVVSIANGFQGILYINKKPLVPSVSTESFLVGDVTDQLASLLPLVSIRLAPSVDNNRCGSLGTREVINRMQLTLSSVNILTTHDVDIRLLLNAYPKAKSWVKTNNTSLSQLIIHNKGDEVIGGTQIYNFRAHGGNPDQHGRHVANSTTIDMGELATLGNSILGGDDVYPNGPDIITVCASIINPSGLSLATPFNIMGRLTWKESQA